MRAQACGLQGAGDWHGDVGPADQRLDEDEEPGRQVSTHTCRESEDSWVNWVFRPTNNNNKCSEIFKISLKAISPGQILGVILALDVLFHCPRCECVHFTGQTLGVEHFWMLVWISTSRHRWDRGRFYSHVSPFVPDTEVWWHYMLEMAFYWSLFFTQFSDVKRKDFTEMFIHHLATLALLTLSWTTQMFRQAEKNLLNNFLIILTRKCWNLTARIWYNFFSLSRIGSLVILVHDFADHWMELAKMAKYAGLSVSLWLNRPPHIAFTVSDAVWHQFCDLHVHVDSQTGGISFVDHLHNYGRGSSCKNRGCEHFISAPFSVDSNDSCLLYL